MKTNFTITADTADMTVTLVVTQGKLEHYRKQFDTVADAAQWLLDNITRIMGL